MFKKAVVKEIMRPDFACSSLDGLLAYVVVSIPALKFRHTHTRTHVRVYVCVYLKVQFLHRAHRVLMYLVHVFIECKSNIFSTV